MEVVPFRLGVPSGVLADDAQGEDCEGRGRRPSPGAGSGRRGGWPPRRRTCPGRAVWQLGRSGRRPGARSARQLVVGRSRSRVTARCWDRSAAAKSARLSVVPGLGGQGRDELARVAPGDAAVPGLEQGRRLGCAGEGAGSADGFATAAGRGNAGCVPVASPTRQPPPSPFRCSLLTRRCPTVPGRWARCGCEVPPRRGRR